LIVKNEQASLPACLASTADLVDEIIVVDTGSTDQTRTTASKLGARVIAFDWIDDFSAARNESLRHARGDWIFYLDADEHLDEANREKLRAVVRGLPDENIGYLMKQRSRFARDQGLPAAVDTIRLFRNHPEHRWRYRVHEQILPALRSTGASLHRTDIVIEHSGYEDPACRQRKIERNLHLLQLDHEEHPEDPVVLFYLGWTHLALGHAAAALPLLRGSRQRVTPAATFAPLLFLLESRCLGQLGRRDEALAVCESGRVHFPADAVLLFEEALLRHQHGDPARAETCFRQLLKGPPDPDPILDDLRPLTSLGQGILAGEGLRGYRARHHLALLLFEQGRLAEADAEWRAALDEQPAFVPAAMQLGELVLAQQRWQELEQVAGLLENAGAPVEAALFRTRGLMARQAFSKARRILQETITRHPDEVWPRVLLSQVLLQEGQEEAAEVVLRDVLQRDPCQVESWRNLAKLLYNQDRLAEAAAVCAEGRQQCPDEPDLLRIQGLTLHALGHLPAAERCLERFVEIQSAKRLLAEEEQQRLAMVRYTLAQVLDQQKRPAEAEGQWRALVAEQPGYTVAWLELGRLYLAQQRWPEVEEVARHLEAELERSEEAALLRAGAQQSRSASKTSPS
jgi:tetratricopeptide (TPR) repeat protein